MAEEPAERRQQCLAHSGQVEGLAEIKADVAAIKSSQGQFLKWHVFAFIITGLCTIGMVLITFTYRESAKDTQMLSEKNNLVNTSQDARIAELERKFISIDEKLDRNYELMKKIVDDKQTVYFRNKDLKR